MKKPIATIITDTHLSDNNIEVNKSIYQQAIEITKGLGLKTILHGGDIFHSRQKQSQVVLTTFKEILDNFSEQEMQLVSIKGNHDCVENSSDKSFLDPFSTHPAFTLFNTYHSFSDYTETVGIHFLSHFSEETYIPLLKELSEKVISRKRGKKHILLTHCDVSGGRMNNNIIVKNKITTDLFAAFDLVCIGHWHDMQILDNGRIKFISASVQHSFGEATGKGITVLYNDLSTEIIPLKYPQYLKYEIAPKDITNDDIAAIKAEKSSSGDNIRIILTGSQAEVKSFNKTILESAGISVEHKVETITKEELNNRVEPFTTKSLWENFEAFCDANNLDMRMGSRYFKRVMETA